MENLNISKGNDTALTRPAPPGRRRTSSRNTSRFSSTASPTVGPKSPSISSHAAAFTSVNEMTTENEGTEDEHHDMIFPANERPELAKSDEIPLEEVEIALAGMSREDLVLALKRAKEQMDILDFRLDSNTDHNEILESRVGELIAQVQAAEGECKNLQLALRQREDRLDELMKDQDREEDEIFAKSVIIERLRKRVEESDKNRIDVERKYQEHIATADKERQSFLDMETLLQTQKAKASVAHERLQNSNHELSRENERLQQMVSQLKKGSRNVSLASNGQRGNLIDDEEDSDTITRSDSIRTLQAEAKACEVDALQAELTAMVRSHDMLTAQIQLYQVELNSSRTINVELREQNESYMNILQEKTFSGALLEESSILNGRNFGHFSSDSSGVDDIDDVPDEPKRVQRKRGNLVSNEGSKEDLNPGITLASELDTSGDGEGADTRRKERKREKSEALSNDIDELQKEIRILRESNQALTLYVNKILDRIISVEGYENVLSADGDNRNSIPSRKRSQRFKQLNSVETPEKKGGGGLLSFISPTSETNETKSTTLEGTSFASRAKRSAGIDWRSLIGGGGLSTPSSAGSVAKKISSSEEIEDAYDAEEKERIRRSMMSAGIVMPDHQLKSQKRASALGTFFSKVLGTTLGSTAGDSIREEVETSHIYQEQSNSTDGSVQRSLETVIIDNKEIEDTMVDLLEARKKALRIDDAGKLTEVPHRVSPLSSRRDRVQKKESSGIENAVGETTFESVGGDESFRIDSPTSYDLNSLAGEVTEGEDRSWGKALKRMSMMTGKSAE